MKIVRRLVILGFSMLLFALAWVLYRPHQTRWRAAATWGNATPTVRTAVLEQLGAFQDGYTRRDTRSVDAFMDRLFSRDHPVVLGTMPGEIHVGYAAAGELVKSDWESWGDVRFRIPETAVSAAGDVAWFAMPGSVAFDLSRFLVLPLRLSGVMVKESGTWKLRQLQFQFDLDLSGLLLLQMVLLTWVAVNAAWLFAAVWRRANPKRPSSRARMRPT